MIPGSLDTGLLVVRLHTGLELDPVHILQLVTGSDIEFRAQSSVAHQPIFVVGFQPVDLAVLIGEEGNCLEHLVVIFQAGYLVIFVQRIAKLLLQVVVGAVANSEHAHSVVFQFLTEHPVGLRKVGRQKYKVFHPMFSFLCYRSWGT